MGISQRPFIPSVHDKGNCDLSDPLWRKLAGVQHHKRRQRLSNVVNRGLIKSKRCRIARRVRVEGSTRSRNDIGRKVRVLKKLIPNSKEMELEGLFRETADYILDLQMRVRVMQIMVNVLSP